MSSAWLSAAIQEFEQVTLDNGTELFRVRARAQRGDDPEPRPVLVTRDQGGATQMYEPLASGGDRRGLLRLAYAIPTDRIGPSTAFSLRLPDGYRIELPEPTTGDNQRELEDDQPGEAAVPESEHHDAEPGDVAARRVAELEQELAELRSASGDLQRRLAELSAKHEQAEVSTTRAHEELKSLRGLHGAVEEELRSTRQSVAQALSELELASTERDTARRDAETAQTERDEALEAIREHEAEHARLTARLRQLEARIELLRAEAANASPDAEPRLRKLESEREQLATHVRALAELLSADERSDDTGGGGELGGAVASSTADPLETVRAHAVSLANEDAERELRELRAGTPH